MVSDVGPKVKGVVSEIGLERDENQFLSFNLKIGVLLKSEKNMNYEEGERVMKRFRKDLLGREVEVVSIVFSCPTCGKNFNSEQGMKQHIGKTHSKKPKKRRSKASKKVEAPRANI